MFDMTILTCKALSGKATDDEISLLKEYNDKYNTVRSLYMAQTKKKGLVDFQFSPGEDFMACDAQQIVDTLLGMDEAISNGAMESTHKDFGDFRLKSSK